MMNFHLKAAIVASNGTKECGKRADLTDTPPHNARCHYIPNGWQNHHRTVCWPLQILVTIHKHISCPFRNFHAKNQPNTFILSMGKKGECNVNMRLEERAICNAMMELSFDNKKQQQLTTTKKPSSQRSSALPLRSQTTLPIRQTN